MRCYDTIARVIITHCVGRGRSNYILSMIGMMITCVVWVRYTRNAVGLFGVSLELCAICVPLSYLVCATVCLGVCCCLPWCVSLSTLVCAAVCLGVCRICLSACIDIYLWCVLLSALVCAAVCLSVCRCLL